MIKKIIFILLILVIIPLVASPFLALAYQDHLYPGIKIAGLKLGGKDREEALNILEQRINYFQKQGIVLSYGEREWKLSASDIDLSFNPDATLNQAFGFGHEKSIWTKMGNQAVLVWGGVNLPLQYTLNQEKLDQYLQSNFAFLEEEPIAAELRLNKNQFEIIPEKEGVAVNLNKLKSDLKESLDALKESRIEISLKKQSPPLTRAGVLDAYKETEEMINKPLKLKWKNDYWTVHIPKIITWLEFIPINRPLAANNAQPVPTNKDLALQGDFTDTNPGTQEENGSEILTVSIKSEEVAAFLETIAPEIEQEPENARFKLDHGKVALFELGQDGQKINLEATIANIEKTLKTPPAAPEKETEIVVETTVPDINNQNINDLGIKTLISTGASDFTGSPANRKHNIGVGSEKFNGVLIAPNEEFSAIKTLGEVSAATGYKPELVIKPEGTIPEFGGGLCQVSTTLFRAAIYAGLPITERKAHKYVVSYYKPTGMDATIYIPHPDLRFKNNTSGHILIQKRIEGNQLFFDFYGTDDGRKIEIEGPRFTSDWISPGPAEYIETNTLKKGEKKQIEKEHKGVSTVFHRVVTKNGEEILKDSFYSKYQPWNAVFLVGTGGEAQKPPTKTEPAQKAPEKPAENKKTPPEDEEN